MPMPPRRAEPPMPGMRPRRGRRFPIVAIVAALAGVVGGWFLRPALAPDPRIADAARRATDAEAAASSQKIRADALDKSLQTAARAKRDAEAKLAVAETAQSELASKTADDVSQRKAADAVQTKLRPALDRGTGTILVDGTDVHVRLATGALFKPNDDALSDHGKAALGKLAAALKELADKQILVQGHTDDTPVALARPAPPSRGARSAAAAPAVRFPTNWELSAARALAVVHYLQDTAKLDPTRLTALAFSQYAPLSKKDRSVNRRIEIVITARRPATAK
jgi:chemotaxis protein MotB